MNAKNYILFNSFTLILTLLISNICYSQKLHDFNIHFRSNVSEISWTGQHKLDSVEIEIPIVYLLPTHYSGYYKYDGSYHYSPYNFPAIWHKKDSCPLIAFDKNGIPYYSSIPSNSNAQKLTISLKKFESLETILLQQRAH